MSGLKNGLNFNLEWRISLFTAVMVPLMLGLGFWQLQRGEDKAELASAFEMRQQQRPAPLSELWESQPESLAYTPVHLRGTFVHDKYFLLDNRVQNGRVGYEVLGILELADAGGSVLVNRGWIAGNAVRQSLPTVPVVEGSVDITGHVYVAPGEPYLLAEQQFGPGWPKLIQAVQMDKLGPLVESALGRRVFSYPVRIDAEERGALGVNWQVVNMSPQKHQGYAVQWFTMAAVLAVFYLLRSSNLWQLLRGSGRTGS